MKSTNLLFLFVVAATLLDCGQTVPAVHPTRSEQIAEASAAQSERLRRCSAAVKQVRPREGGPLVERALPNYLDACLVKPSTDASYNTIYYNTIAYMEVKGWGNCNGILLTESLFLTARHCVPNTGPPNYKILNQVLPKIVIKGKKQNGENWLITGVSVAADPLDTKGHLYERLRTGNKTNHPTVLDFIVLLPVNSKFPTGTQIPIEPDKGLVRGDRLLVAWLYKDAKESLEGPVVDDLESCVAWEIHLGYFEHYCQAISGSSGAPIFNYAGENLTTIVGLHSSRAGAINEARDLGGNEGVLIPRELLELLSDIE